jgi:hypothetical protein
MANKERLTAMEELWDALCKGKMEPESPAWHRSVMESRRQKMDSPDAQYVTLGQLRKSYR